MSHEHTHHHEDDCCCEHEQGHAHNPEHEEGCCCEHEQGHEHHHEHEAGCCCEHEQGHAHHHKHEEGCCCGHEQEHHHKHEESCCCEHEQGHEHHPATEAPIHTYIVENLDCANCAAKIERKIQALPGVEFASITFTTKKLRVAAADADTLLPLMLEVSRLVEADVNIIPEKEASKVSEKEHDDEGKKDLITIIAGIVLFGAAVVTGFRFPIASFILYVIAYLILGLEIVWTAIRNIFKGNIFDENFLMSIATIGAFVISEYPEAVGVMLFYRIGELFEHMAVEKSRSQIMDAIDMRPETVTLLQSGDEKVIPASDAVIGDIVLVRPGDRIPLDGTIIAGASRIDTSAVTGEPVPVSIAQGSTVLSGCMNLSGVLQLRVDKPLSESMVTRILNSVENAAASKPKIDKFITRFSRIYTPFVVVLALLTAIVPSLVTGDWNTWVYTALTFLVISCPCALVLSVPLAFFSGIGAGSRQGILFKGGVALESLQKVKAIVMDKTGTITKGNFVVQSVVSLTEQITDDEILSLAASCEAASNHPIAQSIVEAAREKGLPIKKEGSVTEISGHGMLLEDAEGTFLCGNKKLLAKHDVDISAYSPSAYGTEVLLAQNGILIGYLVIADTVKEEAATAIRTLKKEGLITVMLTGDAQESAEAVANKTGIDEVHARLLPEEKLQKLAEIREKYGAVLFVGDGINDAPVLAGADVGAAMGSGADAAIEAADVVYMTSSVEAIPASLKIARATGRIATQNVVFALVVKALIMILGLARISSMWLAVFADTGVAMLCILNSIRILYKKTK